MSTTDGPHGHTEHGDRVWIDDNPPREFAYDAAEVERRIIRDHRERLAHWPGKELGPFGFCLFAFFLSFQVTLGIGAAMAWLSKLAGD